MTKSNRRRKLDRARCDARTSQKRAAAGRRRAAAEQIDAIMARFGKILDPSTAASEFPGLMEDLYLGAPVPSWLVPRILESEASPDRLAAAADAMLAGPPRDGGDGEDGDAQPLPSVTALSFAAAVALARGNAAGSRRLLDQALAAASGRQDRARLTACGPNRPLRGRAMRAAADQVKPTSRTKCPSLR